jgi:hypothetical protein
LGLPKWDGRPCAAMSRDVAKSQRRNQPVEAWAAGEGTHTRGSPPGVMPPRSLAPLRARLPPGLRLTHSGIDRVRPGAPNTHRGHAPCPTGESAGSNRYQLVRDSTCLAHAREDNESHEAVAFRARVSSGRLHTSRFSRFARLRAQTQRPLPRKCSAHKDFGSACTDGTFAARPRSVWDRNPDGCHQPYGE